MAFVRADNAPAHTGKTLLEIKNISVDYRAANGTVHALTDVNITVERGQILGLAGESGSGKSTLAYAITRLLRPPAVITGGEILYYQRDKRRESNVTVSTLPDTSEREGNMANASSSAIDILQLPKKQLRAFRWQELAIVFQSAMNALNPVMRLETQIADVLEAHDPSM